MKPLWKSVGKIFKFKLGTWKMEGPVSNWNFYKFYQDNIKVLTKYYELWIN